MLQIRLDSCEEGRDGYAGDHQCHGGPAADAATQEVGGAHCQHRPDEGRHRKEGARAGVLGESHGGAEAGPGGNPEEEGIGEGVSKDSLIRRPGQRQGGADQCAEHDPRETGSAKGCRLHEP